MLAVWVWRAPGADKCVGELTRAMIAGARLTIVMAATVFRKWLLPEVNVSKDLVLPRFF